MDFTYRFLPAGDRALMVEFGAVIDETINARVHLLARFFGGEDAPPGIEEIVPTYRSLLVMFDPFAIRKEEPLQAIGGHIAEKRREFAGAALTRAARTVEIPVCYGGEFGPDLADVAAHSNLTEQEVVDMHSAARYKVYMLGFLPGFPYLGGLNERIACPRLLEPRLVVPAGSVGIAGGQTGVYPVDSPGGWRLIGRTPVPMYAERRADKFLVKPGDILIFKPVSEREYAELAVKEAELSC